VLLDDFLSKCVQDALGSCSCFRQGWSAACFDASFALLLQTVVDDAGGGGRAAKDKSTNFYEQPGTIAHGCWTAKSRRGWQLGRTW
jgi:hypothetical protein